MASKDELEDIASTLGLMVAARRRMRMTGDEEGAKLMTRYFKEIDKIDPRLVASAENYVVGCGVSLSDQTLNDIKASVRKELGEPPELDRVKCKGVGDNDGFYEFIS